MFFNIGKPCRGQSYGRKDVAARLSRDRNMSRTLVYEHVGACGPRQDSGKVCLYGDNPFCLLAVTVFFRPFAIISHVPLFCSLERQYKSPQKIGS